MWKSTAMTMLLLLVAGSANADVTTRSDATLVVLTDEVSHETYMRITLPQVVLDQRASVAYGEVSFHSLMPVGTDLEFWLPTESGPLPWRVGPAAENVPLGRVTTMEQGLVRIDITQLSRLWGINSGKEFLIRVKPDQEAGPLVQSSLSDLRFTYHKVKRQ